MNKHCPVTGKLLTACDCGACDLGEDEQDGSDGEDTPGSELE